VLYEAESIKSLLRDYYKLCKSLNEKPKRILLSFAPASTKKDIPFLKWLGVEFPPEIEDYLLRKETDIHERSIEVSADVLRDILEYIDTNGIMVPLGLVKC